MLALTLSLTSACSQSEVSSKETPCRATVVLGDALGQVREARVFADKGSRRRALADLEVLIITEIEAEPEARGRQPEWEAPGNSHVHRDSRVKGNGDPGICTVVT